MTSVVLHGPHFGRRTEGVGDALGGALVIGREADADMTIIEDRVVLAVRLFDLVQRLGDQNASSSSVSRRPIWLRINRTSGLVRLMSDGGTTR
jgi:hypothetical protein